MIVVCAAGSACGTGDGVGFAFARGFLAGLRELRWDIYAPRVPLLGSPSEIVPDLTPVLMEHLPIGRAAVIPTLCV